MEAILDTTELVPPDVNTLSEGAIIQAFIAACRKGSCSNAADAVYEKLGILGPANPCWHKKSRSRTRSPQVDRTCNSRG